MVDFKNLVEESEGPMNLTTTRGKPLFDTDEDPTVESIAEKLVCAANVIVDHRIAIALGLEQNTNAIFYSTNECEWIIAQIQPMLQAIQQTKKIQAENMKDITKLLNKGKVSIVEAKELMNVVAQISTMELLETIK